MESRKGTPKSLREACKNGIEQFYSTSPFDNGQFDIFVAQHVEDFLRNKFTAPMLQAKSTELEDILNNLLQSCIK